MFGRGVLVTTTDALAAAFGGDDLAGLVAVGTVIIGDPEVVRRLVTSVHPGQWPTRWHITIRWDRADNSPAGAAV
ncbi:hypothetical protein ABZ570_31810 [Micromonospora sp. NPDC007271]|uniref:hypothetical protein n=1 Tax=Micromonospora sp. NPDC007271 TaxID=3154587 RepID=UPI0033D40204